MPALSSVLRSLLPASASSLLCIDPQGASSIDMLLTEFCLKLPFTGHLEDAGVQRSLTATWLGAV